MDVENHNHNHTRNLKSRVKVAIRVRPMISKQSAIHEKSCIQYSEENRIIIGKDREYSFDHIFRETSSQKQVYEKCVKDLVHSCFEGYNAAILAYGQTGSGKTFTMGTSAIGLSSFEDHEQSLGIIPRVIQQIFDIANQKKDSVQSVFKVSFIEIYNQQIIDLLSQDITKMKTNKKNSTISSPTIRQQKDGSITLVGVTEEKVTEAQETLQLLQLGGINRTTASTLMNDSSSRSHGIFTLTLEQHPILNEENDEEGFVTAKFYFVDLAGSERIKKTGASGNIMREGININLGLLELGNVISALSTTDRKQSQFITYRNSKLTRLLKDCLGGNSNTYMIACISPAQSNYEESLNSIKYAAKAMNIKNKPVINRDPHSTQINNLRQRIMQLEYQNKRLKNVIQERGMKIPQMSQYKNDPRSDILTQQIRRLKSMIFTLEKDIQKKQITEKQYVKKANNLSIQNYDLNREIDRFRLIFDEVNKNCDGIIEKYVTQIEDNPDFLNKTNVLEQYISQIQDLEAELYEQDKINSQLQTEYEKLKKQMEKDESILITKNKAIHQLKKHISILKQQLRSQPQPPIEPEQEGQLPQSQSDSNIEGSEEQLVQMPDGIESAQQDYKYCNTENSKKLQTVDQRINQQQTKLKMMNQSQINLEYQLINEMKQQYHKKIGMLEKEKQILTKQQKQLAGYEKNPKLISKIESLENELRDLRRKSREQYNLEKKVGLQNQEIKQLMNQLKSFKVQKIEINRKIKEDKSAYEKFKKERIREAMKQKKENLKKDKEIRKLMLQNKKKSMQLHKNVQQMKRVKKINNFIKTIKNKKKNKAKKSIAPQLLDFSETDRPLLEKMHQQTFQKIMIQEEINYELEKYQQRVLQLTAEISKLQDESATLQLHIDRLQTHQKYQQMQKIKQKIYTSIQNSPKVNQQLQENPQLNDYLIQINDLQDRIHDLQDNITFCENRQRELNLQFPQLSQHQQIIYSQSVYQPDQKDKSIQNYQFLLVIVYECLRMIARENIAKTIQKQKIVSEAEQLSKQYHQLENQKVNMALQYRENLAGLREEMLVKYYGAIDQYQNNISALQTSQQTNIPHLGPDLAKQSLNPNQNKLDEKQRKNFERKILDLNKTNRQLSADVEMWRRKCSIFQEKYHNINVRVAKDKYIGLPNRSEDNVNPTGNTQAMLEEVHTMIDKLEKRKANQTQSKGDDENFGELSQNRKNDEQFCKNKWECLRNLHAHNSPIMSVSALENTLATGATKSVKIWDLQRLQLIADLSNSGLNGFVKKVLFLPEQNLLLSACEKQVHMWDSRSYNSVAILKAHKDEVRTLHYKENILFSGGKSNGGCGSLLLWDLRKIQQFTPIEEKEKNLDIFTMTSHENILYYGTRTHQVRRMNFQSLELLSPFEPPHMDTVTGLSVVGNMLISGSKDKNLKLWSLQTPTNNIRCTLHTFNDYINCIETDKMFPIFYSGSRDGQIKVATVGDSGDKIKFIGGIMAHTQSVNTICPLDNNGIFISGSSDRCIKIWKPCSNTLGHLYHEYGS